MVISKNYLYNQQSMRLVMYSKRILKTFLKMKWIRLLE